MTTTQLNPIATSTATPIQRGIILGRLRKRPHSTLELRDLGICSPAPRVQELREQGYQIETSFRYERDSAGVNHRIGVYTLISEPSQFSL